jgi:hypothetical protein
MPKQNDLPSPVTYGQKFYAKAAGMDVDLPEAITPEQKYLEAIAEGGGGGGGTSDYTDLTNKPKINDMTLAGNKSLNDLGIVEATALTNSQVDAIMNS